MESEPSGQPRRGDRGAYERYLRGMDATMRQKVALTAAHLLAVGRVADLGMGSGSGTHALASLYPALRVTGIDVDPAMVDLAREKYVLPNLSFAVGDLVKPVFPPESLDGAVLSSVLHHVTTFGGYRHENAADAIAVQALALRPQGVLVVRDFVDPGPGEVLLDLPAGDGDGSSDPRTCATARLFERFAGEFRSLSASPGFPWAEVVAGAGETLADLPAGWRRFRLSHKHAVEFVLRKDYRTDWVSEVQEEYTYFTQEQLEARFAALGLRVLASTPIRNPWIVRNRFTGRMAIRTPAGRPLEPPATNYVIVGQKVSHGEGVRLREAGPATPIGFLQMAYYRDRRYPARVLDLVQRPNLTVDVLPHFVDDGDPYVLARMSYPRPVLRADRGGSASSDGFRHPEWVTEPINVFQTDKPLGQTVEEALARLADLRGDQLIRFQAGSRYYPSPGGVQEEVRSVLVEIEPVLVEEPVGDVSGFSTSGRVRAIEARQLLRAAQVGGLPDARLELNVYDLLAKIGFDPGPWIGEQIAPAEAAAAPEGGFTTLAALAERPARRRFERVGVADSPRFLELRCSWFEEIDATGEVVRRKPLELVVPRSRSCNTVAIAPLLRHAGRVYLGIDDRDLPAAQCFEGHSQILVAPAWRLPHEVDTMTGARRWVVERLAAEYALVAGEVWELGGAYYPSPGVTPEVVHAMAVEARSCGVGALRTLRWIALDEVGARRGELCDGHLRIVALRAAHALGVRGTATLDHPTKVG